MKKQTLQVEIGHRTLTPRILPVLATELQVADTLQPRDFTMRLPIRISTSPPSFSPVADDDMSFYCDLREIADRASYAMPDGFPAEIAKALSQPLTVAYSVVVSEDREIGLLFCHEDEEEGLMYCAFDPFGTITREPAANEALWTIANTTRDLPPGHRLSRVAG